MALTDITPKARTINDDVDEIREKIAQVVALADIRMQEIRNIVRIDTRAAIAAQLGSDAAAMLTVYTKLKEAIEAAKKISVEDLP